MKVLMGQVGSGKTTELLNECLANDGIFVVSNVAQREMIKDQLKARGVTQEVLDRVVSINTLVNNKHELLRKYRGTIYIDNVDYCLRALIGKDKIAISCNFDEVTMSRFMGRDIYEFTEIKVPCRYVPIGLVSIKDFTPMESLLPRLEIELPKTSSNFDKHFKYVDPSKLKSKLRDYFKSHTILETEDDDQIDIAFNKFLLEGAYCHYFDQKEVPDVRDMEKD